MGNKTKGPVMLLFFLLLVAIAAAVLGFIGLQKEKQVNASLSQEKEEIEIKKKAAEREVSNVKHQVDGLLQEKALAQAKIQEFNSKITSLDDALSVEKKAKEDALLEAEKLREEAVTLKNAKSKLEADLKESNERIGNLKGKLDLFESSLQKRKAEQAAQDAKPQDVQLEKIVIAQVSPGGQAPDLKPLPVGKPEGSSLPSDGQSHKPEGSSLPSDGQSHKPEGSSLPSDKPEGDGGQPNSRSHRQSQKPGTAILEGKVLVVNKEYDFVVVNIGQKDNLAISDTLEIFHKEKKLGELKVEEVRDSMSVAIPVEPNLIKQIKEDDRVARK